ncbi:GntR family transcriptional regulator [Paenibacillaceae bacterium WGS1546]|uniref:GntR family transcriptional regulator n=1 Tax=Cohnella sp. WGS1546 TaxID=3366810 RepID=UPI00372D1C60
MNLNGISMERNTLGSKAYAAIRDEIVSLRLRPGQMIFENAVAAMLGVSRTPVREAFYRLQQEELIEILPQRGARVAYLSVEKMKEAQWIRESLEMSAFAQAARNWNPDEPKYRDAERKASALLEEQRKVIDSSDYTRYVGLDERFHEVILETTGNSRLLVIVSQMKAHLNRMRYLELQEARHEKDSFRQHEEIFAAIRGNDAELTGELLQHHLRLLLDIWPTIIEKNKDLFQSR